MSKFLSAFNNPRMSQKLVAEIKRASPGRPLKIMEVCGTHTMAIFRSGIKQLLPSEIELVSGPGCPVCVTTQADIDYAVALAAEKEVVLVTFGDMLRVPGTRSSLEIERDRGARIEIVYSPQACLSIAKENPDKQVVFLGIGFETTTPTVAATIIMAEACGINNFTVFARPKTVPNAMLYLSEHPDLALDGFLCPGNVSVIIGSNAYRQVVEKASVPAVIAGFEPLDIFSSLLMILRQIVKNESRVENQYSRLVREEGNLKARQIVDSVFQVDDANWRGIGVIPKTGLRFKRGYQRFNAEERFRLELEKPVEPTGCRCGSVLLGKINPTQCPLFGKTCTIQKPVGACMVSSEGTCAAYFKYSNQGL